MSAAVSTEPTAARRGTPSLRAITATLALWAVDALLFYASLPLLGLSWWFGLVFMLFAALVHLAVIVASVGLVVSSLAKRAWRRAGTIAVIAATCAVAVHAVDWNQAFIRHQVAWHQDALRELAARYSHGDVEDGSSVPSSLGVLSSDDVVHVWSNDRYDVAGSPVLFIQTWQDWRAENGMGLAYFRLPPDAATWVRTAEGDGGHPVRDLGNGWWWVE